MCVLYAFVVNGPSQMDGGIDFDQDPTAAFLWCCYIGHYACCNGDTWASELGVLSSSEPRLITAPWRHVPRGTNGGVSMLGTIASTIGGFLIGLTFYLHGQWFLTDQPRHQPWAIVLGGIGGGLGSLIDSFLGATVQVTWYDIEEKKVVNYQSKHICGRDWLNNEQVNVVSVFMTTLLSGFLGSWMFRV